jgi:hypothetical protein
MQTIFKYKLDFYYQQTLIYLVVGVLYVFIRGNVVEDQFTVIYRDPIVYIMVLFFLVSLVVLLLNLLRDRKLIIQQDQIIFHSRKRERTIHVNDIEWMHIGRERLVQTAGRFQLIVFKIKNRRRIFRIRVGRYERSHELVYEMEKIAARVPRGRHKRFGMQRRKPRV